MDLKWGVDKKKKEGVRGRELGELWQQPWKRELEEGKMRRGPFKSKGTEGRTLF